jgi:hypothetical protein
VSDTPRWRIALRAGRCPGLPRLLPASRALERWCSRSPGRRRPPQVVPIPDQMVLGTVIERRGRCLAPQGLPCTFKKTPVFSGCRPVGSGGRHGHTRGVRHAGTVDSTPWDIESCIACTGGGAPVALRSAQSRSEIHHFCHALLRSSGGGALNAVNAGLLSLSVQGLSLSPAALGPAAARFCCEKHGNVALSGTGEEDPVGFAGEPAGQQQFWGLTSAGFQRLYAHHYAAQTLI